MAHPLQEILDEFITFVALPEGDPKRRLRILVRMLDEIASEVDKTSPPNDSEISEPGPPARDYDEVRGFIAPGFTSLGLYSVPADPADPSCSRLEVGDAVDDLVEIYRDASKAVWCFEHISPAAGILCFRGDYYLHTVAHLRNLQWILMHLTSACSLDS